MRKLMVTLAGALAVALLSAGCTVVDRTRELEVRLSELLTVETPRGESRGREFRATRGAPELPIKDEHMILRVIARIEFLRVCEIDRFECRDTSFLLGK